MNAGSYAVVSTVVDPNYAGSTGASLVIGQSPATVTVTSAIASYDGTAKSVTVTTAPAGLTVATTYNGSSAIPTGAGSYSVSSTIADPNYSGSGTGSLVISPASAAVTLSGLTQTYDGTAKSVTVSTTPGSLATSVLYNGSSAAPTAVGSYTVTANVLNSNYTGSASGTLKIAPGSGSIALGSLVQAYNGSPRAVSVTTTPSGLSTSVTYNGSTTVPTLPGLYAVVATITDPNESGTISGSLDITITALVNHAPVLNGIVDGSVQMLSAEGVTFNSSASVSGDLLVPGTPTVTQNGHPTFGGIKDSSGTATPTNYSVTLNSGAVLRNLVRKVNAIAMPSVPTPPAGSGTRSVSINSAGQSPGDFTTLKNLTLNSNVGSVAVPPGSYGAFTANSGGILVFGVAGATTPSVYNLQSLTINSGQLQVVGPVIINLASALTLNGSMGTSSHPSWITLSISSGGLTLNGSVTFSGYVTAPTGTVTINGSTTLNGEIDCNQLTINGNGLLNDPLLQ